MHIVINEKCNLKVAMCSFLSNSLVPSPSVLRGGGFGLGHLLKDGSNFFLFVITFPEIVESENVFGNFLDFVHVNSQL